MNSQEILATVEKMQAAHQKVASELEAMTRRAHSAETALAKGAVTKIASHEDLTTKTAALTGRLVSAGVLSEDMEAGFREKIVSDPTELFAVCNKIASMLRSGSVAQVDADTPDEPESDGLDPIERFAR